MAQMLGLEGELMRAFQIAAAALGMVSTAMAQETVDIKEWAAPYENSRPRDPFAESANSVWFVGQAGGYLANLNVETGEFSKVDLPDGSRPHNLIVDSDGIVWYAGNTTALIGRYDPKTEAMEEIPMPDPAARDPHTLIFDENEENIFFTVQGGNMIGRLNIDTRKVDLVSASEPGSRPYGIKLGPDGSIWAVLFGKNKLAHIDPDSLELTEIDLPRAETRPRRLEVTADGKVWFVDYAGGMLGRYDPESEEVAEWAMPQGAGARPYGTALDSSGRLWMVATGVQPNVFIGFDPETEEFFGATEIPSGGGAIRHMHYHEPSGAVWFGTDANTIGRAIVTAPATN
jgi:virginiamycin B lyase